MRKTPKGIKGNCMFMKKQNETNNRGLIILKIGGIFI